MYLIGSLLLALVVTLLLVSKIAAMLHAKKPGVERVFLASLVGGIAAVATLIVLGLFVKGVDPIIMLILSIAIMLLVSSMAFKTINVMSWSSAITTNIANIVLILVTGTAAVVLNNVPLDKTINSIQSTFNTNAEMIEHIAAGETSNDSGTEQTVTEMADDEVVLDENIEPTFKEIDLLPAGAIRALKEKEKKVYREPKYHVVSINNIRSIVGKNIRILNNNGKSITGALKNVRGNNAVVEQRLAGGFAITPISFAKIRKLEVYR